MTGFSTMTVEFWPILGLVGLTEVFEKSCAHSKSENETEVSFFNRELYEQFKHNPTVGHRRSFLRIDINPDFRLAGIEYHCEMPMRATITKGIKFYNG